MRLPLSAKLYIIAIVLVAFFVIAQFASHFLQQLRDSEFANVALIFTALALLTQIYEIELVYRRMISIAVAIWVATILLGGPLLALAVALVSTLIAETILRWGKLSEGFMAFVWPTSFNIGQLTLSAFIASLVFDLLGGRPLMTLTNAAQSGLAFYNQLIPAVGAFAAFALTNNAFVSGIITMTQKTSFFYHLRFNVQHLLLQILSLGVLGILLAVVYAQSPWNLLLVLIPLGLVHLSLRNYMKLRHEAHKTFERMATLLRERDSYTGEHSNGVAQLAEKIALKLKLPIDQIEKIKAAAAVHDLGKVIVPDEILQKPGPLTEREWEIIKKHPDTGADLLKGLEMYGEEVASIIRYAHEHWDGSGYPQGLEGEEIPLGARIVSAADVYQALTTDRPYRKAYSHEEAVQVIRELRATVLDPQVVDALLSVLKEKKGQEQPTTPPQKTLTA